MLLCRCSKGNDGKPTCTVVQCTPHHSVYNVSLGPQQLWWVVMDLSSFEQRVAELQAELFADDLELPVGADRWTDVPSPPLSPTRPTHLSSSSAVASAATSCSCEASLRAEANVCPACRRPCLRLMGRSSALCSSVGAELARPGFGRRCRVAVTTSHFACARGPLMVAWQARAREPL